MTHHAYAEKMREYADREAALLARSRAGERQIDIARSLGVSQARVSQILKRARERASGGEVPGGSEA